MAKLTVKNIQSKEDMDNYLTKLHPSEYVMGDIVQFEFKDICYVYAFTLQGWVFKKDKSDIQILYLSIQQLIKTLKSSCTTIVNEHEHEFFDNLDKDRLDCILSKIEDVLNGTV